VAQFLPHNVSRSPQQFAEDPHRGDVSETAGHAHEVFARAIEHINRTGASH
jgi:hypothetical protein